MKRGIARASSSTTEILEEEYNNNGNGRSLVRGLSAPISGQSASSNEGSSNNNGSNHNGNRLRRRRRTGYRRGGPFKIPSVVTIMAMALIIFLGVFFSITAYFMFYLESFETPDKKHQDNNDSKVRQSEQNDRPVQNKGTSAFDSSPMKLEQPHHQARPSMRSLPERNGLEDPANFIPLLNHNNNKLEMDGTQRQDFFTVRQREAGAAMTSLEKSIPTLLDEAPHNSTELIDMRELSSTLPFDNPDGGSWRQGWDVQPRTLPLPNNETFHIFVVPHSHCDPGWLKTFDDYFRSQTRAIISSVVKALEEDERRKFIWAEISYFSWWWVEQDEHMRSVVRQLLESKQLEFVTGGWVQPDEANSNWDALEIQMQEGLDWIAQNIGPEFLPKYGWSIDPFGYSPTLPYMLKSQFGMEGILIQRVHYAVKKALAKKKHLEFYWRQTWDKEGRYDMLTHIMPFYSYDVPHTCGPDPSICCQFDFARTPVGSIGTCPWKLRPQAIDDMNIEERATTLLDQYLKKGSLYRGNAVLVPLGDDFRYITPKEATLQYTNYQKLFDYINQKVEGVQIQFGTLSQYFETIRGKFIPPILKGSFFTYADVNQDYWSGYFTSRVFDKALDRQLERVIYTATSLGASRLELQIPRRQLSLFQHHDGVTGTAKTHVVKDYAKRMYEAIKATQSLILEKLPQHNSELAAIMAKQKSIGNHSSTEEAVSDEIGKGSEKSPDYQEIQACWQSDGPRGLSENMCGDGETVFAYNPLLDTTQNCGNIPIEGGQVRKVTLPCETPGPFTDLNPRFHNVTGMMIWPVHEQWLVWVVRSGGAYLFFPDHTTPYTVVNATVQQGGYVVATKFWRRTVIERPVLDNKNAVVLDFIYEINLQESNREWFVRFSTDVQNNGTFHTDLNGFNFDTHHRRSDLPIQSQVFPMPAHAAIQDDRKRLTVLSEHAQGTASLEDGAIDVFLDRRLQQDDKRGLGQGVMDNVATRTRFRVVVEQDGYETSGEFQITPLCRREWNQLNHPLEFFGHLTKQQLEHHISMETQPPASRISARRKWGVNGNQPKLVIRTSGVQEKQQLKDEAAAAEKQLAENEQLPPGYAAAYAHLLPKQDESSNAGNSTTLKQDEVLSEMNAENEVDLQPQYGNRLKAARLIRMQRRQEIAEQQAKSRENLPK
ncbi:hypothetical protein ACA910_021052 [Epithemia clementina (nom. ined.)]